MEWPIRVAYGLCRTLPYRAAAAGAEKFAPLAAQLSPPARRAAVRANLALVLGDARPELDALAGECFRSFVRYLVDFFSLDRADWNFTVSGKEHLEAARHGGRGAILLTAHLGNWELGGAVIRRLGYPITAVAWPHPDRRLNEIFEAQRRRFGIEAIPLNGNSARECLEKLRAGSFVGLLGDRLYGTRSIGAVFAGRRLAFPVGPAWLSRRARVPVLPAFCIRKAAAVFELHIHEPIFPERASETTGLEQLTQQYVRVIESQVRAYPGQWLIFHDIAVETVESGNK